jgi:hypothetical protein
MNALELIHKDHQELKEMLGRVEDVKSVGGRSCSRVSRNTMSWT